MIGGALRGAGRLAVHFDAGQARDNDGKFASMGGRGSKRGGSRGNLGRDARLLNKKLNKAGVGDKAAGQILADMARDKKYR